MNIIHNNDLVRGGGMYPSVTYYYKYFTKFL